MTLVSLLGVTNAVLSIVMAPFPITLSRRACSIIPMHNVKRNIARELVGEQSGQIHHHVALYVEESFVYFG